LNFTVPPFPAVGGRVWMASGGTTVLSCEPVTPRVGLMARVRPWAARMAFAKLNSTSAGVSVSPLWNFTPSRRTKVATVVEASHVTPAQFGFEAAGTVSNEKVWARSPPMLPSFS
jgi:hypothetical protein